MMDCGMVTIIQDTFEQVNRNPLLDIHRVIPNTNNSFPLTYPSRHSLCKCMINDLCISVHLYTNIPIFSMV